MKFNRRFVLRGIFQGSMVSVALPFLDCFLDNSGQALAATGVRIPTRFSTFCYGLGLTDKLWIPNNDVAAQKPQEAHAAYLMRLAKYETPVQLKALEPYLKKMNLFSGYRVPLDDSSNIVHWTGSVASATGNTPPSLGDWGTSMTLDQIIADSISTGTRFKSIEVSCAGNKAECYSALGGRNTLTAEIAPHALYMKLFGPGYQDPTKGDWKPDPNVMMQQSVLTMVSDDRKRLMQSLGASDRARMDQFFTAVRDSEQQMTVELTRPEIVAQVTVPQDPGEMPTNKSVPAVRRVVPIMSKLGALALATDQTRVFNLSLSDVQSTLFMPGDSKPYHQATHEEAVDATLGYQPTVAKFATYSMELFASMLKEMDGIQEGDGTLLDHGLLFAFTDTSYARVHALDGVPMMTAGGANGRVKTGMHIAGAGSPVTRVGLTVQQAMGIQIDKWGKKSLETNKPVSEILA